MPIAPRIRSALATLAVATAATSAGPAEAVEPRASDDLSRALAHLSAGIEEAMGLIEASRFNGSDQERAEGARRVLRQLVRAIISEIGTEDDEHPVFFRGTDRFLKAGLDNPDNHYLWSRISPNAQYRVVGTRGTTADFVVQVYRSMPGLPDWPGRYTTGGFFDANNLTTDAEGNFELLLGGEKRGTNWLALHDDSRILMIRYTHNDWLREKPGDVRIERIGAQGVPSTPLTSDSIAARIERAHFFLVDGTRRYLEVTEGIVDRAEVNTVPKLYYTSDGGVPTQVSSSGHFSLRDDEALIVTTHPSKAPYQGFQLGNLWFESLEYGERLTSYTSAQARQSSDGLFHFVVSAKDPGVPNWLDTAGHRRGMLLLRWQGIAELPDDHQPTARKVKLSEVRAHLPADEPKVTPEARREQLARRQQEILARFPW